MKSERQKIKDMACEICGRNSCTKSFHSIEEQVQFDDIADNIKDRMRDYLIRRVERLKYYSNEEDDDLVLVSDVIDLINDY